MMNVTYLSVNILLNAGIVEDETAAIERLGGLNTLSKVNTS